jgi:CHAT domain-containing protein/tetratricopeptide (TPR) repeat protein
MRDLVEQLQDVLKGGQSLEEFRASVSVAAPLYCQPSLKIDGSENLSELDRQITSYADWELRSRGLISSIEDCMRYANEHGAADFKQTVNMLEAVSAVTPLLSPAINRGLVEFRIGYAYWLRQHFAEAIPHLRVAQEALQGDLDEGYSRELLAITYLLSSLSNEKKWDEALSVAEGFLQRSRELKNDACEAAALRHIGLAQVELGREPALDNLEEALCVFDRSSDEQRREYSVADRSRFLEDLGNVARSRGSFERALSIFRELVQFYHQDKNQIREARAVSEIGYTYLISGEPERSMEHLNRAADLAEKAEDYANAARWRRQVLTHSGKVEDVVASATMALGSTASETEVYEAATVIESMVKRGLFQDALPLIEQLLEWARKHKDLQLQIAHLNNLATCHANTGNEVQAIAAYRQAIKLADGLKNIPASLLLRHGLGTAYINEKKSKLAYEVLLSATAFGEVLLDQTESMEVRQQIVSGMLPIQELFALLLSETGNHELMIAVTEGVRTRNLKTWMRAADTVSEAGHQQMVSGLLRELRAAEVEFEVREITGTAKHSDIRRISETRTGLRKRIDAELSAHGLPSVAWSSKSTFGIGDEIAKTINPGDAAVFLFGVSEGLCVAAAHVTDGRTEVQGSFIDWTREDRLKVLAPWIRQETDDENRLTPEGLAVSLKVLRERLFEPTADLFRGWNVANVLAIPHGELALVPLWDILELANASGALTVAPSLGVFGLCTRRSRSFLGPTLVVGDRTRSLRYSQMELDWVKAARSGVVEAITAEDIKKVSSNAAVIHVAGHGVFNPKNPYLSGIIVSDQDYPESWSSQYVAAPREFSYDRNPEAWPLLTAAACMGDMSLEACNLVVLSACESGVPRLHGGGEMTGLPNAFIVAGARSVVASLWRVHDAPTAVLMHLFYEILERSGESTSVALSLKEARRRLVGLSRDDVNQLLGPGHRLQEDYPFQNKYVSDAFHCYGAY